MQGSQAEKQNDSRSLDKKPFPATRSVFAQLPHGSYDNLPAVRCVRIRLTVTGSTRAGRM